MKLVELTEVHWVTNGEEIWLALITCAQGPDLIFSHTPYSIIVYYSTNVPVVLHI